MCSEPPPPGCGEGKCGADYRMPSRESRQLVPKRPEFTDGFQGKAFKDRVREGRLPARGHSADGGEGVRSQQRQLSASSRSGVCVLVGSTELTSSTWWGFQCLQGSSGIHSEYCL